MPDRRGENQEERLQKVLARAGVASRRRAEEYITEGRVKVNGQVVTTLGTKVNPATDLIEVDGQPVDTTREPPRRYYLLYKPVGYLSTVRDTHGRPTARDLVPAEERLYPVGRLDLDSEGLLLFTNDGELAYRLMHPRYEHEKEYMVLVEGQPTNQDLHKLRQGMPIGEKRVFVRAAEAMRMNPRWRWRGEQTPPGHSWLRMVLKEGQKRQIRYMLQDLGYKVVRLIRVRTDQLTLENLEPGKGRWLSTEEVQALRRSAGFRDKTRVRSNTRLQSNKTSLQSKTSSRSDTSSRDRTPRPKRTRTRSVDKNQDRH
ncbi:MAG: rRNA pseudouridine synthase [Chloroflexi bacterium]|jgi:23S rRNA pseudouridine2605 synthase|nr:rRNA pseudouridine synthase [Chloroflexota bacterium]